MHHIQEIAGILLFLMGAMTIVELIDAHEGFKVITDRITSRSKVKLMWIIALLSFFLSAALDNLTRLHHQDLLGIDDGREAMGNHDRGAVRRLVGHVLAGDAPAALAAVSEQYALGLDPEMLLRELLDLVHGLTRARMAPAEDLSLSVEERATLADWSQRLSFPALHRLWQLLLKGLGEVQTAPVPLQAAEMALLRLIHASDLPDPGDLARRILEGGEAAARTGHHTAPSAPASSAMATQAPTAATPLHAQLPQDYVALVALFKDRTEPRLAQLLNDELRLVDYRPGSLTIAHDQRHSRDQLMMIGRRLNEWTGHDWSVTFATDGGGPTLLETERREDAERHAAAATDPVVAALFASFPDAELADVAPPERIAHAQSR
jgi:DNA polymerase-3 subunit gamma/tau